jgi:hypothetical protein
VDYELVFFVIDADHRKWSLRGVVVWSADKFVGSRKTANRSLRAFSRLR